MCDSWPPTHSRPVWGPWRGEREGQQMQTMLQQMQTNAQDRLQQMQTSVVSFQVFKSPHALHGHMRHCKKSVDRMAHSNHYTGGGKKPMERVDGGAGSSQLANGTRKRLHGIKLQGMSKDERAKWCFDPPVPKGKKKRKASPVASARNEFQEGSAMQTAMQAAPKVQKAL